MKNLVIFLALATATPALSQTPDVSAIEQTAAMATIKQIVMPATWEFSPDFLRDQNRINWWLGSHRFVATATGTGINESESIYFAGERGSVVAVARAYFGKRGELQKQELLNGSMNPLAGTTDSVQGSTLSLRNTTEKAMLNRRVLRVDSPTDKRTLTINYDARGRRQSDVLSDESGKSLRTINYIYDARGLSQINDGATITNIERDTKGKLSALNAKKNGLLMRSTTPIKNDKSAIIGTRTEDYQGGVLQEVNEITQSGNAKNSRVSQSSSDKTIYENGQQTNEKKFEFRMNIGGPKAPAVAAVGTRKRTLYTNAKIVSEELFRSGVLTQRSEFNDNGIVAKIINYNADGSVASEIDASKAANFYVDGTK